LDGVVFSALLFGLRIATPSRERKIAMNFQQHPMAQRIEHWPLDST
jgi:hypothetical protein